jgi:hypothetical protein
MMMTMTATITIGDGNIDGNQRPPTPIIVYSSARVLTLALHRATPHHGSSSPSDSEASDFGARPSKRRRIIKTSHKPRPTEIILPAERMSSRLGAKVVNYNEDEDDDVREEDLMPNESGELWTYGMSPLCLLIAVDEPEAQDAIDAIVDHRRVAEDGTSMSSMANQDSVEPPSENVNPYTDLEYCVRFLPAELMSGKMARTIAPMEYVGIARETQ